MKTAIIDGMVKTAITNGMVETANENQQQKQQLEMGWLEVGRQLEMG